MMRYHSSEAKFAAIDEKIRNLTSRTDELEVGFDKVYRLTNSVERLADNMERMAKEQEAQGKRIANLEGKETAQFNAIKNAALVALVGGIIGACLTKFLSLF